MDSYLNPRSASPQIIIGNPLTGQGSDDSAQAFRKYNAHTHRVYSVDDFRAYKISAGDQVWAYDANDVSVFDLVDAPVVVHLSKSELILSVTSSVSLANTKLFVGAPKGAPNTPPVVLYGVTLVAGSNLVVWNPTISRAGFVDNTQMMVLSSFQTSQLFYLNDEDHPDVPDPQTDPDDLVGYVVHTPQVVPTRLLSVQLQFNGGMGGAGGAFTLAFQDNSASELVVLDDSLVIDENEGPNLVKTYLGSETLSVIEPDDQLWILVRSLVLPPDTYSVYLSATFEMQRLIIGADHDLIS